jgi:hypothetical protein
VADFRIAPLFLEILNNRTTVIVVGIVFAAQQTTVGYNVARHGILDISPLIESSNGSIRSTGWLENGLDRRETRPYRPVLR